MRALPILALLLTACGNSVVVVENIIPIEGPLMPSMFTGSVSLDPTQATLTDTSPLDEAVVSLEVDTSRGFCQVEGEGSSEKSSCNEEAFGPHYALVTIANWNEEALDGGSTGTVQFERYTVDISRLDDDAPEINGFNGLLGISIAPQYRKTFAVVLMGLDGKAEFRSGGVGTPRRYAIKYTFEGPGGLVAEGGATVLVGDFARCESGTPVSFCSSF